MLYFRDNIHCATPGLKALEYEKRKFKNLFMKTRHILRGQAEGEGPNKPRGCNVFQISNKRLGLKSNKREYSVFFFNFCICFLIF